MEDSFSVRTDRNGVTTASRYRDNNGPKGRDLVRQRVVGLITKTGKVWSAVTPHSEDMGLALEFRTKREAQQYLITVAVERNSL